MQNRSINTTWNLLAVQGILTVLFGTAATFWPGITLAIFVYLFAAFILFSGFFALISGLATTYGKDYSLTTKLLVGILGLVEIVLGSYLIKNINVAFATLILLIGFSLVLRGTIELFNGIFEHTKSKHKILIIFGSLITVIAGIALLFQPESTGVAFIWIVGLYALIKGILLIALAFDIKAGKE